MIRTEEDSTLDKVLYRYESALEVLTTKFNIINEEYKTKDTYNPIEHIKGRVKTKKSIYNKLTNDGYEINLYNIANNIHDGAGIRIVCPSLEDVRKIEKIIEENPTITIINKKDYIENPKESGYRSLHLKVLVPVETTNEVEHVEAEIQIRTIAMDMWASLQHKLSYKPTEEERSEEVITSSLDFAQCIKKIDKLMDKMTKESINNTEFKSPEIKDKIGLSEIMETSMLKYELAQEKIITKVNSIYHMFASSDEINPIEHIKTRIKPATSICQKLEKNNYEITTENMQNHIHDAVGIRIVCSFLSDLEIIKNELESDPEINIIKRKDYVTNPKQNGYRSYHMNILVPVRIRKNNQTITEQVEVEIQIRTIAMDMWASLEHILCYKKEGTKPKEITENLKTISDIAITVDEHSEKLIKENQNKSKIKALSLKK